MSVGQGVISRVIKLNLIAATSSHRRLTCDDQTEGGGAPYAHYRAPNRTRFAGMGCRDQSLPNGGGAGSGWRWQWLGLGWKDATVHHLHGWEVLWTAGSLLSIRMCWAATAAT